MDSQRQLMGTRDAVSVAEARFVVLVGDLESFELFGVRVLVHAVVPVAHVHGRCTGRPHPDRRGGEVGGRVADVQAGRVELPEVAESEAQSAADTTDVPIAWRSGAGRDRHPRMVRAGALAQREAVGAALVERVVVPLRDEVQAVRHLRVGDLLDRMAGHLLTSYLFTWIAAQTGQTADCLGEEAGRPGQADVAVVGFVAHDHVSAESQPGQEVPVGIAVPDEAVHDAYVGRHRRRSRAGRRTAASRRVCLPA